MSSSAYRARKKKIRDEMLERAGDPAEYMTEDEVTNVMRDAQKRQENGKSWTPLQKELFRHERQRTMAKLTQTKSEEKSS